MATRSALPVSLASLCAALTVGCGTDAAEDAGAVDAPQVVEIPADQQIRTGDPYARGYTDADFPRVKELAAGVFSYEQLRSAGEERFTTVSLFVITDEGVVVADGQGSVEETQRLVDHIATLTDQPITDVVICSDHGDHTAGNSAFPADADFYAHPWSAGILAEQAMSGGSAAERPEPTQIVEDMTTITRGGKAIEVHFLGRAHTGGDLVVYLPDEKIMFMSEAYLHRIFPAMRSAYPSEWVEMIEAAQAMDVDVYVPGHGFVDHPTILEEELEVFQGAIRTVIDEATRMREEGYSVEDAQEQILFGDLESWSLRESQGDRAIAQVYAELDGSLPGGN